MSSERPHVVIVGAGFGGLRAARKLARAPVRVTVIDRRNYHLFQPLLYQVATAGLEPEAIAHPVRAILRRQKNASFRLADARSVDLEQRRLETSAGPIDYDWLILAFGAQTNFFGLESVRKHSLGLKDLEDAVAIRNQVLRQFELAAQQSDPDVRRTMLTFVVVGGGPTGVEVSGMFSELIRLVLAKDFPELEIKDVRVILLEAAHALLGGFPARLREATAEILWRKHVDVRFGAAVKSYDGEKVELNGGEIIPTRTVVWAAGAAAAPLSEEVRAEKDRIGRLRVSETLQLGGQERVFVIGDAACTGDGIPMMAQPAIQMGRQAARNIRLALAGKPMEPFRFRDPGSLATIGRNQAVARVGKLSFTGFAAWIVWLIAHLVFLIGFRNRLLVLVNWAWDYFLYERAVRLITTDQLHPPKPD